MRALCAVALLLAMACAAEPTRTERALAILEDRARYDTADEAGEALAEAGMLLAAAGRDCRREDSGRELCRSLLASAAVAQVFAVKVLRCTAPGRYEARTALADHLRTLLDEPRQPTDPPKAPRC